VITALREGRIIITRNSHLTKSAGISIVELKAELIREQIREIIKRLSLKPDKNSLFTRCILCNELLNSMAKDSAKNKVPEYVFKMQENFVSCPKCKRIYWQGTHWGNVSEILRDII
jgi:uncharacterized protein with PIN domain